MGELTRRPGAGSPGRRTEGPAAGAAGLSVVVALLLLAGGLALTRRGIDLLDGAYQLRLIAFPDSSRAAGEVYLFEFLVHPLYEALGHDVALLRATSVVLLAGLAGCAAADLVRMASGTHRPTGSRLWPVVAATAASTLLVDSLWVRNPGYRYVALVGLVLLMWGMARLENRHGRTGGALVGVGLVVAGAGKPTTGAAALLVLLVLASVRRWWRWSAVAPALAAGGLSAAAVLALAGMTPPAAVAYLSSGARLVSLLGDHSSVPQMLGMVPPDVAGLVVLGSPVLLVAVLGAAWLSHPAAPSRARALPGVVVALLVVGAGVAVLAARLLGPNTQGHRALSVVLVVPVLALTALIADRRHWDGRHTVLVAVLVLPYTHALGSNVAFTLTTAQAGCLWVAALGAGGVLRQGTAGWSGRGGWFRVPVALGAAVACVVAGVVTWAGYRDGPDGPELARATVPVPVAGGELLLKPGEAEIARRLRAVAQQNSLGPGTPVVDLTGVGAGYAFLLGGRPLGRAHFYGTWEGRVDSARYALERVPCEDRAVAWLLHAPDNPSDVSAAFTDGRLDLAADYDVVATVVSHQYGRTFDISVLRPRPSVAAALDCRS